tara:strand:- start:21914 stop:22282 length:369 start_codon:yes stop_codon:yes gene_type:complete
MIKVRPSLPNLINSGTNEIEIFQNKILRPVIKMQHQLLIASFQNYLQKRKIDFSVLSKDEKLQRIHNAFQKDINYKNLFLGYVIGHFELEEYQFYTKNSSEINKRILSIIKKRIEDSILELI